MPSASDTCNSRPLLSWLMKSCLPNPHNPFRRHPPISADATSISSLPDDLLLECLSRVHNTTLPSLPSVCRHWADLLNSPAFHVLRHRHRLLRHTLFSIHISNCAIFTATLQLENFWKVSTFVPTRWRNGNGSRSDFSPFSQFGVVAIGRKIYVIGRTAMLRYDTWTGTLVPKAGMGWPRKKFAAASVAGKILVAGGCAASSAVEEYDPDQNKWCVVSDAPRRRYGCIGTSVDGLFYVIGGLKIGNDGSARASRPAMPEAAHVYPGSMDLYDVTARAWLRSRALPGGGCVVAACAAAGDVYILSSHAVELSFWKFNGSRSSAGFGEWGKIASPPVPAQVRLDSRVRFSCVGVGSKVVLVQVAGCIDDLLRRSGRQERGLKERLVLVYDCAVGVWSRGADMPEVIRRAACVCVQC